MEPSPPPAASAPPTPPIVLQTPSAEPSQSCAEVEEVIDELCPNEVYNPAKGETEEDSEVVEKESDPAENVEKDNVVKIVHAVARVENSPFTEVTQDDVNSLERFIFSEEHLKKNIVKALFQPLSKWEICVQLFVDRTSLWENPRSYIWRHLGGTNFWDRNNGTKIKLVKIHVE